MEPNNKIRPSFSLYESAPLLNAKSTPLRRKSAEILPTSFSTDSPTSQESLSLYKKKRVKSQSVGRPLLHVSERHSADDLRRSNSCKSYSSEEDEHLLFFSLSRETKSPSSLQSTSSPEFNIDKLEEIKSRSNSSDRRFIHQISRLPNFEEHFSPSLRKKRFSYSGAHSLPLEPFVCSFQAQRKYFEARAEKFSKIIHNLPYRGCPDEFDKDLISFMKMAWEGTLERPEVSAQTINRNIRLACQAYIFELFALQNVYDINELKLLNNERKQRLHVLINKSGLPLYEVFERLALLRKSLTDYLQSNQKKTLWSEVLFFKMQQWLSLDAIDSEEIFYGKDLHNFIVDFKTFCASHTQIAPLLRQVLGDSDREQKDLLIEFYKWINLLNLKVIEDVIDKTNQKLLRPHMKRSFVIQRVKEKQQVSEEKSAFYILDEEYPHVFNKIGISSICRSLKCESILIKPLKINGKLFNCDDAMSDIDFYTDLFLQLYLSLHGERENEEETLITINSMVKEFLQSSDKGCEEIVNILKLMTVDCWGIGNDYLRLHCPTFFDRPYVCDYPKGIACSVVIRNPHNIKVSQHKLYNVYRELPHSMIKDESKLLMSMPITWTVKFDGKEYIGSLHIPSSNFCITKNASAAEIDLFLNTLAKDSFGLEL